MRRQLDENLLILVCHQRLDFELKAVVVVRLTLMVAVIRVVQPLEDTQLFY